MDGDSGPSQVAAAELDQMPAERPQTLTKYIGRALIRKRNDGAASDLRRSIPPEMMAHGRTVSRVLPFDVR